MSGAGWRKSEESIAHVGGLKAETPSGKRISEESPKIYFPCDKERALQCQIKYYSSSNIQPPE